MTSSVDPPQDAALEEAPHGCTLAGEVPVLRLQAVLLTLGEHVEINVDENKM